jgi:flagellar hook-length control protein FliK
VSAKNETAAATPAPPRREAQAAAETAEPASAEPLEATARYEPLAAEARRAEAQARTDAAVVRGAPETVAKLAAQLVKKLEQRSTRFELALDPAGLGGVQVSLEINARGELAAHMSFERPEAAAELRSRAQELHRALEQAGFELSRDALSFEHNGQREFAGRDGQEQGGRPAVHHARAFEAALNTAELADFTQAGSHRLLSRARPGVDVRI